MWAIINGKECNIYKDVILIQKVTVTEILNSVGKILRKW